MTPGQPLSVSVRALVTVLVLHFTGSPFQFTVGPITEGGAHKVQAAGPGLELGSVLEPNEFNIYTREAGAGGLSIAIEGPSKVRKIEVFIFDFS